MKKVKLCLSVAAFVVLFVGLSFTSNKQDKPFFVESDNIAFAQGYRCVPVANWTCYIPGGELGYFLPNFLYYAGFENT